jgi:uncharacterized protein YceK
MSPEFKGDSPMLRFHRPSPVVLGLPVVVLAGISFLFGCGTMRNLSEQNPEPYGGLRHDAKVVRDVFEPKTPRNMPVLMLSIGTIDLPLSLIGDTVTLPIVLWKILHPGPEEATPTSDRGKDG